MKFQLLPFSSFLLILALFACSKDKDSDIIDPAAKTIQGFWKGSTSPMQTSSSYAVGVLLKQNGTARSYHYYQSSTFPSDTSQSAVFKCDGTYLIANDSLTVTCAGAASVFIFHASVDAEYTALQGKLTFGETTGGVVLNNLNVSMNK